MNYMIKEKKIFICIILIIMGGIFIAFPVSLYTGVINARELFGLNILTIQYFLPLTIILGIVLINYGARSLPRKGRNDE